MEFLIELGLFLAKAIIIVTAVVMILGAIASNVHRPKEHPQGHIDILDITQKFKDLKEQLMAEILDKKARKQQQKEEKKLKKAREKLSKKEKSKSEEIADEKSENNKKSRLYVIDFDGDVHAHAVSNLREEISAILTIAEDNDEVLLRLESPGGVVHGYGHAASQLKRLAGRKIQLTVVVDEVAASGGYMMACVADKIIAAPFAIIGSIGVIAEMPNFNRLLKKHDIDIELHTAGEFKRTLTMLGENTESGREKFKQELNEAHELFKRWVHENREQLDIDQVATGEHWFGQQALELKLIDELGTSDDYIMAKVSSHDVYELSYQPPKQLSSRISKLLQQSIEKTLRGLFRRRSPLG
ncbi:MAG TPA: protease SohB [Aeromonadales bacterium]|nr:protease SohB [Aeromonadales bacterium]